MKKVLIIILMTFLSLNILQAQSLYTTDMDSTLAGEVGYEPDSALVAKMNPRQPLWLPILESIGLSLAIGSFNSYVMDSEFAKISFKSIEYNFERGWSTDADEILTNMFMHPFNGSMFYNFARSSGYNYWTSLGVAAIGSFQWEYFMEIEPPALNDWVMTSFGGSMLGETFYRLSNLILNESATGWKRFWLEAGAGVFNPARLFNRLVTGKTARHSNEKLYETQPFAGELAVGMNNIAEGTSFENDSRNLNIALEVAYGRLFYKKDYKPFDYFRFNSQFNFWGTAPGLAQFRIAGVLTAKSKKSGDGRFLYGLFSHFDYLHNNVYEIGSASFGPSIGIRTNNRSKTQFIGLLHTNLVLMGAAKSDYAAEVEFLDSARTYNMGPGAFVKLETLLKFPFGAITLDYSFWWIHTWDGTKGDEQMGMLTPAVRIKIYKKLFVGYEYLFYHHVGKYDEFPDSDYRNNEQRLFLSYNF